MLGASSSSMLPCSTMQYACQAVLLELETVTYFVNGVINCMSNSSRATLEVCILAPSHYAHIPQTFRHVLAAC
jgi:hypothetical protein